MLRAGFDDTQVDSTQVDIAVQQLKTPGFSVVAKALQETDLGKHVTTTVAALLQTSGRDAAGDGRLQAAQKLLLDSRLPRLETQDDTTSVHNIDFLVSMQVVDVTDEILDTIKDAISHWSRSRLASKSEDVSSCINSLHNLFVGWDDGLGAYQAVMLHRFGFNSIAELVAADSAALTSVETKDALGKLLQDLEAHALHDDTMEVCSQRFIAFVKTLPPEVSPRLEIEELKLAHEETIQKHAQARQLVLETVMTICSLAGVDLVGSAIVEDWQKKRGGDEPHDSLLSKAVRLSNSAAKLAGQSFKATTEVKEWMFEFQTANGEDTETTSAEVDAEHVDLMVAKVCDLARTFPLQDALSDAMRKVAERLGKKCVC